MLDIYIEVTKENSFFVILLRAVSFLSKQIYNFISFLHLFVSNIAIFANKINSNFL